MESGERDRREDETCREFVLPALHDVGWTDDQISDEYPITGGRIRATALYFEREMSLRADYALEFTPGLVIGVVEAKRTRKNAGDGIEQAKRYARLLDVPFAYATNGREIFEIDRASHVCGRRSTIARTGSVAQLFLRPESVLVTRGLHRAG